MLRLCRIGTAFSQEIQKNKKFSLYNDETCTILSNAVYDGRSFSCQPRVGRLCKEWVSNESIIQIEIKTKRIGEQETASENIRINTHNNGGHRKHVRHFSA